MKLHANSFSPSKTIYVTREYNCNMSERSGLARNLNGEGEAYNKRTKMFTLNLF